MTKEWFIIASVFGKLLRTCAFGYCAYQISNNYWVGIAAALVFMECE